MCLKLLLQYFLLNVSFKADNELMNTSLIIKTFQFLNTLSR